MDAQAVIDAADLAAEFGDDALAEVERRVASAGAACAPEAAIRWREARHFLVRHYLIDQLLSPSGNSQAADASPSCTGRG